jgi:photosystem II stability/assembly factor-like uncharacterized protein
MRALRLVCKLSFNALLFLSTAAAARGQWWTVQTSGMDTNLRGVSAVYFSTKVGEVPVPAVWASGSNGVILRSLDQGKTWKRVHVQGGDALDFRGISALSANVAYVISIGNGEKSRIYKTTDGGVTWNLQFTGPRKETFLDAISCDSERTCLVLGDPVDGKFLLMSTEDGEHWKSLPTEKMPDALPNEGAFAASNSSLCVDDQNIYFGTGDAAKARVFHSADSGKTWTADDTPVASGNASSGIFSLSCKGSRILYAVGGDYNDPSRIFHSAAAFYDGVYIPDRPKGWQLSKQQPGGFRSGVANVDGATAVAVGPNGEDITQDFGATWQHTDSINLNAVVILDIDNGWAVGPKGTIARFMNKRQYIIRNATPNERDSHGFDFRLLDWTALSTLLGPLRADSKSNHQSLGASFGRFYGTHFN